MGHGKETPRQKMIGMMYLVLTALLALNVSKDVLDAFVIVEDGLHITNKSFKEKNDIIYGEFNTKNAANPAKVGPWLEKANNIKKRSDELFDQIHKLKREILETGGEEEALHGDPDAEHGAENDEDVFYVDLIAGKDNTDIPAEVMITKGAGKELKSMVEDYRRFLLEMIDNKEEQIALVHSIEDYLNTDDHGHGEDSHPWESYNFEHLPLIAVMTNMSMIQNKIRNIESEMLIYLLSQIDAGSFKVNQLEAVVIPNSNYIIKGNDYSADIFIAARDTTNDPKVLIGAIDSTYDEETNSWEYKMKNVTDSLSVLGGKGRMFKPGSQLRLGEHKYEGLIMLKAEDGSWINKPFRQTFMVAEGSVVVAPTKMNVFYVGVDNPVDISVAGVPPHKVVAQVTNGRITNNAPYIVKPRRPGNSIVRVFVKGDDGSQKEVGSKEFRVKTVPDPVAMVAGKKGGRIQKQILVVQTGVLAEMENFEFDLKFTVTQFTVSTTSKGFVQDEISNSNRFTPAQKTIFEGANRGQRIYIQDIKAVGPDGTPRDLSTINFQIQ